MNTVNLRRYSEADALREISPQMLVALMDEHREFLAGKGVTLPPVGAEQELDYHSLATIFLSPDDIPRDLVEKFYMVKQMSGPEAMDRILDAVRERQMEFDFPADSSPEDVAAHLLLTDRALFQEIYAEKAVARFRAFVYYVARQRNYLSPMAVQADGPHELIGQRQHVLPTRVGMVRISAAPRSCGGRFNCRLTGSV